MADKTCCNFLQLWKEVVTIPAMTTKADLPAPAVMNADQAAAYLGLNVFTLYQLCRERQVPYLQIGPKKARYSFRKESLDEWLKKQEQKPLY